MTPEDRGEVAGVVAQADMANIDELLRFRLKTCGAGEISAGSKVTPAQLKTLLEWAADITEGIVDAAFKEQASLLDMLMSAAFIGFETGYEYRKQYGPLWEATP